MSYVWNLLESRPTSMYTTNYQKSQNFIFLFVLASYVGCAVPKQKMKLKQICFAWKWIKVYFCMFRIKACLSVCLSRSNLAPQISATFRSTGGLQIAGKLSPDQRRNWAGASGCVAPVRGSLAPAYRSSRFFYWTTIFQCFKKLKRQI